MNCRHCNTPLVQTFLDLGFAPPSNAYLKQDDLTRPEVYYPLKLKVCTKCWLVQTEDYADADKLFTPEYAYFSSTSGGWLKHAEQYSRKIIDSLNLSKESFVIEVASNDGYLLKNFITEGIPCLGIEPTDSTADEAEKLGIPVLREFFGASLAEELNAEYRKADLIIGNNVFAHVPDINDFTQGLKIALKEGGTITLEFPHLLNLIEQVQFDTVYHEHFSYLSLYTVCEIFKVAGLRVFDVEEIPTHGGSLRVYGCHEADSREISESVVNLLQQESKKGLQNISVYESFQDKADNIKNNLVQFLIEQKKIGKKVVAYGAAAKGNTLLNYGGIKPDLLPVVFDASVSKQGKFMPGSHIPILEPSIINNIKPDVVLVLPWNIISEITNSFSNISEWNGIFVTAVPEITIYK